MHCECASIGAAEKESKPAGGTEAVGATDFALTGKKDEWRGNSVDYGSCWSFV
jgi:hypothetical protein